MMRTLGEIRPIKASVESDLMKLSGVTGIDIGYKYSDGKKTDVLAIRVYVEEKKDKKDVPTEELIPETIKEIQTDVIQRKFVLHPLRVHLEDLEIMADTGNYDPLKGGISIGPCRSIHMEPPCVETSGWYLTVGTLGAIVKDNTSGDTMLLSNFHVMCVDDGWSVGDTMAQPGRVDGGSCPSDVVGQLQRASLGGQVDCAVASHTARGYSCEIVDIGTVTGTATASPSMAVRKRGRTTGLTYGIVDTVDLTVKVDYCNGLGEVTLTNQIGIDVDPAKSAQFGDHGDSGSVVVNNSRKVVGLHFAGNEDGTYGVANPIDAVLSALNISICVPKAKEVEKKREFKEIEKKREFKEYKIEKIEDREVKAYKERLKEFKEFKEPKEIYEGGDIPGRPRRPPRGTIDERLARLEAMVDQVTRMETQAIRFGRARRCIDFRSYSPMIVPNPWTIGTTRFFAKDSAGAPWTNPGIKNIDAFTGLDCGFQLEIILSEPCPSVELILVHFADPAKVEAYNTDGSLAGTAGMSGPQRVAETLNITGTAIRRVIVNAPNDEALLLQFCCISDKEVEKPKYEKEKIEKYETKEKPEKEEIKETKDKPEKEKHEKHEIKEYKHEIKEVKEKPERPEIKKIEIEKYEISDTKRVGREVPIPPIERRYGDSIEERLARLEMAIAQFSHFIRPESRPDLSRGALRHETDVD